ncbi:hypothetical protein ALC62_07113 [Cyphomyrmex costatus]|uniref:PHD-type domain-containing protein n=1 Tax=Cyphomyrmex costatus TaxID=456900 RepID=A0A195CNR9_9HYME|nr:hypothetical protein ALC62_07113 [Cyphomyrmex costatus]
MQEEKDCVSYPFGSIRDNRCKYCLVPTNGYEIRCNGYCNTIAHFICTMCAKQNIELKIDSNDFFCLWCSVYKIEENACQQYQKLIAQTEDLSINNDGNFNQSVVIPETSCTTSKIFGSSKKSNKKFFNISTPTTPTIPNIYTKVSFSTSSSPRRANMSSPRRRTLSLSETDALNRSTALSGNSSILTPEKSSNMPETPPSKPPNVRPLIISNLTATQQSSNVMPKSSTSKSSKNPNENFFLLEYPTSGSSKNSNENFFKLNFPTTPTTPKTKGISGTKSVSPRLPSVRCPRKPRCPSPQTKTDSYEKDLQPARTQHNVEVNSNLPILHEILLEIKQCTELLNERVSYQKTTSSFERDKGNYLKSLNDLMQSNNDTLRIIHTQIHDVQAQCNELCNFSKNILKDNQSTDL